MRILLVNSGNDAWPLDLEEPGKAAEIDSEDFFDGVLEDPIADGWTESPANTYTSTTSGGVFVYDPSDGSTTYTP